METLVKKRLINTDEYYKMGESGMFHPDERIELINGELCTMAPIGSKHAESVRRIIDLFYKADIDDIIVSSQNPVHIDQLNELQPDIAMLKRKEGGYVNVHPEPKDVLVIMEVSDTTYSIDLNVKLPIYASGGIPVYWIINLRTRRIEVYEDPLDDDYHIRRIYKPGDAISLLTSNFDASKILMVE